MRDARAVLRGGGRRLAAAAALRLRARDEARERLDARLDLEHGALRLREAARVRLRVLGLLEQPGLVGALPLLERQQPRVHALRGRILHSVELPQLRLRGGREQLLGLQRPQLRLGRRERRLELAAPVGQRARVVDDRARGGGRRREQLQSDRALLPRLARGDVLRRGDDRLARRGPVARRPRRGQLREQSVDRPPGALQDVKADDARRAAAAMAAMAAAAMAAAIAAAVVLGRRR